MASFTSKRDSNKAKALAAALSQIERQFGKGAMLRLGDTPREQIPSISTGSLGLDIALGIGGLPKGRIVEIYGPESSGKTTLALQVIGECQKQGGTCAFIDAEHALDPIYAGILGVDVDNLLVSQPDTGEQALEICDSIGILNVKMQFEKIISDLYSETGNYKKAYKHHKEYSIAKDSIFNEEKSKDIGKLEARHEIETAEAERTQ